MFKLIYLLLFVLFVLACNGGKKKYPDKQGARNINVKGMVVETQYFADKIKLVADLLPNKALQIKSPTSGVILEIFFEEGDEVQKGQSLIRLDDRKFKVQKKALEAELALVNNEYARKKTLQKIEAISMEELEAIQDKLILLEAEIDNLDLNIELANLKAPFYGQIGMMDWTVGAYLNQGEVITELTQNQHLKVNFQIPNAYMNAVEIGQNIQVIAFEDTLNAEIYAINPSVDEYSRTLQVRARLKAKGNPSFVSGAFAEIILPVKQNKNAIVVPSKSVLYDIDQQTVYLLKNGKVHKQVVESGVYTSEQVEILNGIKPGDTLLTTGLLKLKQGMKVDVAFSKNAIMPQIN